MTAERRGQNEVFGRTIAIRINTCLYIYIYLMCKQITLLPSCKLVPVALEQSCQQDPEILAVRGLVWWNHPQRGLHGILWGLNGI